jgi:acyl-ACP thioesterase
MAACGISLDELRDKMRLAFILSKIRLKIYRPLYAFEDIEVQTWTCEGRGYSISRAYRIKRGEEIIADADTTWALVNIDDRSLVRSEALDGLYSFENEPTLELDIPSRLRIPKECALTSIGKRRIVYSDLDYNMHMNNTRYPDMLCDYLPIELTGKISGMLLSYVHEAAFGDTLEIFAAESEGTRFFRTVGESGETCLEAQIIFEN